MNWDQEQSLNGPLNSIQNTLKVAIKVEWLSHSNSLHNLEPIELVFSSNYPCSKNV